MLFCTNILKEKYLIVCFFVWCKTTRPRFESKFNMKMDERTIIFLGKCLTSISLSLLVITQIPQE